MLKYIFLSFLLISTPLFAADSAKWEESHAQKPYVALVNEYDVTVNDDYSYEEVYHARVKVQQPEALQLGEWPVYYNKSSEQIIEIKAFTETPDGKKIQAKDILDEDVYQDAKAFSDMRVKLVKLPEVAIGSIIDVTIKSKTITKEIPLSFWHTVPLPVIPTKYARYVYSFPTDMPIKFKAYLKDINPKIEEKNGRTTYTIFLKDTDDQEEEEYMPPSETIDGVLTFSTIENWSDIAHWFRTTVDKATVDAASISVKTLELIKDKQNDKDKARAIFEFIQDNFKYVAVSPGDHGVTLHSTNEIFENKYGDAKDLTLIARQMLSIATIDAKICLFSGEFNGNPEHVLPNPNAFDHFMLKVTLDGQAYYIDPLAKGFDIGQLPASYDNAYIMVIDDQGFAFENLPVSSEDFNKVDSTSVINIEPDGSALFEVKVTLPYEASVQFKQQWVGASPQQQEAFFKQLQANFTQEGTLLEKQIFGANERYGHITFNLKYQAPKAYPIANDMILLKEADQSNLPEISDKPRIYPMFFTVNSVVNNVNEYHWPEEYDIESIPENYDLNTDFMQVAVTYTKRDKSVIVHSRYRTKRLLLEAKRYGEVKTFRDNLMAKNDLYVILKKKSNVSPEAKDWIKKQ